MTTRPASGHVSGPVIQPLSLPRVVPSLLLRAQMTMQTARQRTRTMHLLCPASAAPPPSQLRVRAVGGGTQLTLWAACTVEWVPVRTMISFLDSVAAAAAVRCPGWAVAGVGSGAEEEAGLWPMPGVVKMAHRCRLPLGWMAEGRVAASKSMIRLIGGAVGMVQAVGAPAVVVVVDTMALGVRQDLGVGVVRGGMAQVEHAGADATE